MCQICQALGFLVSSSIIWLTIHLVNRGSTIDSENINCLTNLPWVCQWMRFKASQSNDLSREYCGGAALVEVKLEYALPTKGINKWLILVNIRINAPTSLIYVVLDQHFPSGWSGDLCQGMVSSWVLWGYYADAGGYSQRPKTLVIIVQTRSPSSGIKLSVNNCNVMMVAKTKCSTQRHQVAQLNFSKFC